MTNRNLAEVGARLEKSVVRARFENLQDQDTFDQLEQLAIAILDSEYMHHPPDALQHYLTGYLDGARALLQVEV